MPIRSSDDKDLLMGNSTSNPPSSAAEQPNQHTVVSSEVPSRPQGDFKEAKRKGWTIEKTAAVVSAGANVFRDLMELLRHN